MTLDPTPARNEIDKLVAQAAQEDAARVASLEALQDKLSLAQIRPAVAETTTALPTRISVARANGLEDAQVAEWNPDVNPTQMPVGTRLYLFDRTTFPTTEEPPPEEPPVEPPPTTTTGLLDPQGVWCGHVALTGSGSWLDMARAAEQKYGKFEGPMRVYFQPGANMLPTADHKTWLDSDPKHTILVNIKPGNDWVSSGTGSNVGVIQAAMTAWKKWIDEGRALFILWHEPENDGKPLADYIPMWKRVVTIMRDAAPNVKVGFCSISWFPGSTKNTAYYAQNFYAGAEWVDFFAPDPYIVKGTNPSQLPTNMIEMAKILRALPGAGNKVVIAAEWGADLGGGTTSRGTDQHRADSITAVKNALPSLRSAGYVGFTYYDDGSDYLSASGPDVAAYKALKAATEAA